MEPYTTLGNLALYIVESNEQEVMNRLIEVMDKLLPPWRQWKVVPNWFYTKNKIFDVDVTPQLLQEIRFIFPTLTILKAFDPTATQVTRSKFSKMKDRLLDWALCRALIIKPKIIAIQAHGSEANYNFFISAIQKQRKISPGVPVPKNFTTLGELAQLKTAVYPQAFNRLVKIMDNMFLTWRECKIVPYSRGKLLGPSKRPPFFNQIKFMIPSSSIVKAFRGTPISKETGHKTLTNEIKLQMLFWPLGRALIRKPKAVARKIHGSLDNIKLFMKTMYEIDTFTEEDMMYLYSDDSWSNSGSVPDEMVAQRHTFKKFGRKLARLLKRYNRVLATLKSMPGFYNSGSESDSDFEVESSSETESKTDSDLRSNSDCNAKAGSISNSKSDPKLDLKSDSDM